MSSAPGDGEQDAFDAAVVAVATPAGDPRVPDSSSQGTDPAAAAGGVPTAPAPTEGRVIVLTGEVDEDASAETAPVEALQQPTTASNEAVAAAAGDASQGAPSEAGGAEQPLPAGAGGDTLEKPSSPRPAPSNEQEAAGLGHVGDAPLNPDAPSGSQTVAAGSSSSVGPTFSLGVGELAGRTWGRITFDPSVFQQEHQVIDNIQL